MVSKTAGGLQQTDDFGGFGRIGVEDRLASTESGVERGVIVDSLTKTRRDAGAAGGRHKTRVMVLREKKVQVRRGRIRHSNIRVGLIAREGNQFQLFGSLRVVGGGVEVELAFDGHGRTTGRVGG